MALPEDLPLGIRRRSELFEKEFEIFKFGSTEELEEAVGRADLKGKGVNFAVSQSTSFFLFVEKLHDDLHDEVMEDIRK